jgi:hypothetical protein
VFADHNARHEPGGADPMAADAVAATASLRSIGTGTTQVTNAELATAIAAAMG